MRHGRQARLAEVGRAGQARLASSTAVVRTWGRSGEVEARYLAGAGVGTLIARDPAQLAAARAVDGALVARLEGAAAAASPPASWGPEEGATQGQLEALDLHPAAAEVAVGALAALATLHQLLGLGSWLSPRKGTAS